MFLESLKKPDKTGNPIAINNWVNQEKGRYLLKWTMKRFYWLQRGDAVTDYPTHQPLDGVANDAINFFDSDPQVHNLFWDDGTQHRAPCWQPLKGLLLGAIGWSWLTTAGLALDTSASQVGIDARRLHAPPYNLIGRKIALGQVEIGRPAQFGLDKIMSAHRNLAVTRVFFRNAPAESDAGVDAHAHSVASIMIGTDKALPGIAPAARLYSSAVGVPEEQRQDEECLTAQHVALQNGGDVRGINFSFGEPLQLDPRPDAVLDGNALLTQCVDWSARVHDVVYAIAGNQGKGGIPIPTDNFNGINVAFTKRVGGVFSQLDSFNLGDPTASLSKRLIGIETNVGPRRAIGLVAPGSNISFITLDGTVTRSSGTSLATPHVTASIALLQEYGDRQLQTGQPHWSIDSRRHEVMKAVLLNAADKLRDTGNGLRLGMSRTILDKNKRNWLDSDAYQDAAIPLNAQMGTGQLNTFRAYQQFSPGQWEPQIAVPPIGWDYRTVAHDSATRSFQDYRLAEPLQKGSFVALTLVWDRRVELKDTNQNGQFDRGETFRDRGLNNLDLHLLPADADSLKQSTCASSSAVDSIEHIFCSIPKTGSYKIRVSFQHQVHQATQPYALAWWTVPSN